MEISTPVIVDMVILGAFIYILKCQLTTMKQYKSDYNIVRYIYVLCTCIFMGLTLVIMAIDLGIIHLWLEYWIARILLMVLAVIGIFLFKFYKPI